SGGRPGRPGAAHALGPAPLSGAGAGGAPSVDIRAPARAWHRGPGALLPGAPPALLPPAAGERTGEPAGGRTIVPGAALAALFAGDGGSGRDPRRRGVDRRVGGGARAGSR